MKTRTTNLVDLGYLANHPASLLIQFYFLSLNYFQVVIDEDSPDEDERRALAALRSRAPQGIILLLGR